MLSQLPPTLVGTVPMTRTIGTGDGERRWRRRRIVRRRGDEVAVSASRVPLFAGRSRWATFGSKGPEGHRVRSKRSRISAAVAVSPSLGKMRSTLFWCAAGSRSVMASVARTTL
jgi:hypothetical protein